MRLPRVLVYGSPLSAAAALLTLLAGEPPWLALVVLLTGVLVVFTIAFLKEGTEPVVIRTVRWGGSERRALILPYSRWKLAFVSLLVFPILGLGAFGVVSFLGLQWMESWPHTLGIAVIAALAVAAALPIVALAVGPNEMAVLREGFLVRRGLLTHFVPWVAVTDVTAEDVGFDEHSTQVLRVRVRSRDLIESNYLGRMWRAVRMDPGLTIPLGGLRVPSEEAVSTVTETWKDPQRIERSGPDGTPQAPTAPQNAITDGLQMVIDELAEFVIFHADEARNRYVQVVRDGQGQLRAEAVSNAYLADGSELDGRDIAKLAELGWEVPIEPADNFRMILRVASPPNVLQAAEILLKTLRQVYGLPVNNVPLAELG